MKEKVLIILIFALLFVLVAAVYGEAQEIIITKDDYLKAPRFNETPDPGGENAAYSYIRALYGLNDETAFKYSRFGQSLNFMFKDYQQTLNIKNHPGSYEMNPVLGRHPNDGEITAYFIAVNAIIFTAVEKLPEPWASSVADSVAFTEKLVTENNDRVVNRGARAGAMPMGIVFTFRF